MYTKEDYDAMADYTVPAVLRSNCESLYLGLVRFSFISCNSPCVLPHLLECVVFSWGGGGGVGG
jgi:hypothetical protein